MYVQRNTEARSCNHCYSGKAITVTYSELVFVASGTQRKMCMRHIVFCGLTTSSHKRHDFLGGKKGD
jgi:hypothetical protein